MENFIEYSSARLSPYIDEIIGDHQCGFSHNSATTDHIFCICQILGEKMGLQCDSTLDIHGHRESVRLSQEGSIVEYSHKVWGTHEISQTD
jgi:hypothetical protein